MKPLSFGLAGALALGAASASAGTLQSYVPSVELSPPTSDTGFGYAIGDNFRAKYRFERGLKQFEAGNFNLATKEFKKARRWAKKHPLTNLMVGASLYKQGEYGKAREFLETSLKSGRYVLAGSLRQTAEAMLKEVNAS